MLRSLAATVLFWGALLLTAGAVIALLSIAGGAGEGFEDLAALAAAMLLLIAAGAAAGLSLLLAGGRGWRTIAAMVICGVGALDALMLGRFALESGNVPLVLVIALALAVMVAGPVAAIRRWRAAP